MSSVFQCVCRVLRAMLSLGKGRSWQDALEVMSSVFQCMSAVFSGRCCLWGRVAPGRTPWRWCPQCFSVCLPCSQGDAVAGEGSLLAGRPGGDHRLPSHLCQTAAPLLPAALRLAGGRKRPGRSHGRLDGGPLSPARNAGRREGALSRVRVA